MAADLIWNPNITQTVTHDLESAFYVLLYLTVSFLETNWSWRVVPVSSTKLWIHKDTQMRAITRTRDPKWVGDRGFFSFAMTLPYADGRSHPMSRSRTCYGNSTTSWQKDTLATLMISPTYQHSWTCRNMSEMSSNTITYLNYSMTPFSRQAGPRTTQRQGNTLLL
jgi:hypothetical protein